MFANAGERVRREVSSMPGVFQTSVDELVKDAGGAVTGIGAMTGRWTGAD